MIAMRNRLVGAQMLNACMEETRRAAYADAGFRGRALA